MIVGTDILSLDTAGTSLQAVDNNIISSDSTNLEASFAEVMRTPHLVGNPEFTGVVGEELPVSGMSLPVPGDSELVPEQGFLPSIEELEQSIAPLTDIEVESEAVVPLMLNRSLAELDEAKPAALTEAANVRAGDGEKPSGIHNLRPESDPFTRLVVASDRMVASRSGIPTGVQGNELDLAQKNEQLTTQQRPAVFVTEDAAPRLQNRPITEVMASAIPVSTGSVENLEAVQKPTLSPISTASSAASIQAPQTPQLAASAPKSPAVFATSIDVPVLDESWGNALQDRVMWMTTRNIQNAEIRLNPAELGPIRVQVSVQDDAAQLTFTAQHALTRDALEVALPRLREMLSESGLSLGDATVTDGDSGDVHKDSQAEEYNGSENAGFDQDDVAENGTTPLRSIASSALLDTFV